MAAAQAAENHGDEWRRLERILSMRDIYINSNLNPRTKSTTSSRSTGFEDILPQNMSQMITKTIPIRTRSETMWWNKASCCEYDGKSMETEKTKWSEFPNGWKGLVEQILVSEQLNPKEQNCEDHSLGSE